MNRAWSMSQRKKVSTYIPKNTVITLQSRHVEHRNKTNCKTPIDTYPIKSKTCCNPVAGLLVLVHQFHDVQGICRINYGGSQTQTAKNAGTVSSLADWAKLVSAPGILLIIIPCMFHHLNFQQIKKKYSAAKMLDAFLLQGILI